MPTSNPAAPRVLGVDDFAFRKGHTYGTLLFDQERQRVVDLLPDRAAATFAEWLRRHPGVEIITRDRASAYAQAAAAAAPNATQVADRFHLLTNLRETMKRVFMTRTAASRRAVADGNPVESSSASTPGELPKAEARDASGERRQSVFLEVRALHRRGLSLRQIARDLRGSDKTL